MSVQLKWSGLAELRAALRQLPAELASEAGDIVENAAERAGASIKQAYPLGETGNLRAGVTVTTDRGALGAIAVVRSRSPHAHLYEFGTQLRRQKNGKSVGAERPHPVTVPIVRRERTRMTKELIALVKRQGFQVSGDV